jgi:hypothetical protein
VFAIDAWSRMSAINVARVVNDALSQGDGVDRVSDTAVFVGNGSGCSRAQLVLEPRAFAHRPAWTIMLEVPIDERGPCP